MDKIILSPSKYVQGYNTIERLEVYTSSLGKNSLIIADDFITKKELLNPKNKISYIKAIEELNIYYVAATRAKKVIQLTDLNLSYTYNENDETTSYVKSRFTNK